MFVILTAVFSAPLYTEGPHSVLAQQSLFDFFEVPRAPPMARSAAVLVAFLILAAAIFGSAAAGDGHCKKLAAAVGRPHSVTVTEFGAVGDGVADNTLAFQNAIFYLQSFANKGGAQLFVPRGKWLTGSFSLISHLTLSLDEGAVLVASMDPLDWPIIDPLPSYGRGRELPGGRHQSLIHGHNLTDVVITGENGTIDGQGSVWWDRFNNRTLDYTRPHLIELMYSTEVIISNLTLKNSPFWAIHPVYCSHVIIQNVTILSPHDSPNTDGIDPDSSDNICIEDCYISTGDDMIAIKSGWDEYGISFARPSSNITIRRITGSTKNGAGIAVGSEMSGGVTEIKAEGLHISDSLHGVRIKTSPGRGGYIRNVDLSDIVMDNVEYAIRITGEYGEHPDLSYDPAALPLINRITIRDVVGTNIRVAGVLEGIRGDSFSDICLSNVLLDVTMERAPWTCSDIRGYSNLVRPESCEPLRGEASFRSAACYVAGELESQDFDMNQPVCAPVMVASV